MSNILICYAHTNVSQKYQDFAEEFCKNGHNILLCGIDLKQNNAKLIDQLILFNPDLSFSFNNIIPLPALEKLSGKIAVIDADNPTMFWNKKNIHYPNLYFFGYQSNSDQLYKDILGININKQNYLYLSFTATNIKNDPSIVQDINICFIGTNFYHWTVINSSNSTQKQILDHIQKYQNYYEQDEKISGLMTAQDRLEFLSVLTDLGLQIFGNETWQDIVYYSYRLAQRFVQKDVLTRDDNQDIYNRSKISVNINHAQAEKSFSWRVPDIMASNSCLMMQHSDDWEDLFGKYISHEVKEAIIYQDRYDMRQKCINLLKDEELRLRCVRECQYAIEQNGRWKHRIKKIENFLNIKLLDLADQEQVVQDSISDQRIKNNVNFYELKSEKNQKLNSFSKVKLKLRIKIILYCTIILIAQIPIIDLLITKSLRKKVYKKLEKYQR